MPEIQGSEPEEPFVRISVLEAARLIESGEVHVVDVRRPDEYAEGHIDGAVLIPVDDLLKRKHELPMDRPIIMVCKAGVRSALASEMAAAIGCRRVYNLEGGMDEWIKQGLPVTR